MFRSLFDIVERQRDLREEDRIALLEQWKNSGAKPEITSWWIGYFKVHQLEGSDETGDGSVNAPFKSIQKAVNSVPPGGIALIELLDDYVCSKDTPNREIIADRRVELYGALDSSNQPQFKLYNSSEVGGKSGILVGSNAVVRVRDLVVESNDNGNTVVHWKMLFKVAIAQAGSSLIIGRYDSSNTTKIVLNDVELVDFESSIAEFLIEKTDIDAPGHDSNNPLNLIYDRADRKVVFHKSNVSDLTGGGVNIPVSGLI